MAAEALSEELCEQLLQNLQRGEQSILFVNRRGYSATATCMSCHQPLECPHCSISLKFHAANGRLMCHYCGYSTEVPKACPHCGSRLMRYSGVGTQKVEEALKMRFPTARILRMDQDTTMRKDSHQKLLSAFGRGDYDILIGTQMVTKGLAQRSPGAARPGLFADLSARPPGTDRRGKAGLPGLLQNRGGDPPPAAVSPVLPAVLPGLLGRK